MILSQFNAEIEHGKSIQFGEGEEIAHTEHQRILQRLVVPFRNGEKNELKSGARIEFGRANEIANILQENDIEAFFSDGLNPFRNHLGIQMAFAGGVKLDGFDPRKISYGLGVDDGIHIRLHDADAKAHGLKFID